MVLVPTLLYDSEIRVWQNKHQSRKNAVEKRAVRSMEGITLKDRISYDVIMEQASLKVDIGTRIEKSLLSWIGHVKRMDERRFTKLIYKESVNGRRGRGRPRRTCRDQIWNVFENG